MSDPQRIELARASSLEGELLRSMDDDVPSEEARRRAHLALGLGGATASLGAVGVIAVAKGKLAWTTWVVGGLGIASAVGATYAVLRTNAPEIEATPAVTADAQAAPFSVEPHAAEGPAEGSEISQPPPSNSSDRSVERERARNASAPGRREPPWRELSPKGRLAEEVLSLDEVRDAIRGRDPGRAINLLATYRRKFPHGGLVPEATLLQIEALIAIGQTDSARRVARAFVASDPAGPQAEKVRAMLSDDSDF
jgi:hypothetical protein